MNFWHSSGCDPTNVLSPNHYRSYHGCFRKFLIGTFVKFPEFSVRFPSTLGLDSPSLIQLKENTCKVVLLQKPWGLPLTRLVCAVCANCRMCTSVTVQSPLCTLLCTLPGRRPGIAEGNERTRLGRVHLYFFAFVLIIVL